MRVPCYRKAVHACKAVGLRNGACDPPIQEHEEALHTISRQAMALDDAKRKQELAEVRAW